MTDNDIIKALECCSKRSLHHYPCKDCPLFREECLAGAALMKPSLDLINRQKAEIQALREDVHNRKTRENKLRSKIKSFRAEIDRLNSELKATSGAALSYKAEIERLEIKIEGVQEANAILREHIRKAVKEFAERLKEHKIDVDVSFGYGKEVYTEAVAVIEIDNLVKEMVGEG